MCAARRDGFLGGIGVLAGVDLAVRTLPELLDVGSQLAVPMVVFSSRLLFEASVVGWAINWLTLFVLTVGLAPYLFPEQLLDWASGGWTRGAVAVGAVGTGLVVEQTFRSVVVQSPSVVPVGPSLPTAVGTAAGVVGLLVVATVAGSDSDPTPLLSRPDGTYVALPESERGRLGPLSRVVRGTLLVAVLGVVFACAAQLYPLTELVVIGVVVYSRAISWDSPGRDPVERLSIGAVAAWGDLRHVAALAYLLFALVVITVITMSELGAFPVVAMADVGPVGVVLVVTLLFVPGAYVLKYAERVFRSFAVELDARRRGQSAVPLADPGRAPGFMVTAGALYGMLPLLFDRGEGVARDPTAVGWGFVAVVAPLTLALAYYRSPVRLRLADHHAVPLAVGLWIAAGGAFGTPEWGVGARLVTGAGVGLGVVSETAVNTLITLFGVLFLYFPVGALAYRREEPSGGVWPWAVRLLSLNTLVWLGGLATLYVLTGTAPTMDAFGTRAGQSTVGTAILVVMGITFGLAVLATALAVVRGEVWPRFERASASDPARF